MEVLRSSKCSGSCCSKDEDSRKNMEIRVDEELKNFVAMKLKLNDMSVSLSKQR